MRTTGSVAPVAGASVGDISIYQHLIKRKRESAGKSAEYRDRTTERSTVIVRDDRAYRSEGLKTVLPVQDKISSKEGYYLLIAILVRSFDTAEHHFLSTSVVRFNRLNRSIDPFDRRQQV